MCVIFFKENVFYFFIEKIKNKLDKQLGAWESWEGVESLWNNERKDWE